jgi:glucose-6-phosphate isomerase
MSLALNTDNSFSERAGSHGIEPQEWDGLKARLRDALTDLRTGHKAGEYAFLDLPYDWEAYDSCAHEAKAFSGSENLVVSGIGGSALGPQAILTRFVIPCIISYRRISAAGAAGSSCSTM